MKIIFDNEEQKEEFISILVDCLCPSDITLKDSDSCDNEKGLMYCYKCFEQSGLEMVVGNVDIFYICDRKACEICNKECNHTSDINHATNRLYLHGRLFSYLDQGDCKGLFEMEVKV